MRPRYLITKILIGILTAIVVVITLFPVYWMVLTSLAPAREVMTYPPKFIPSRITLEHWIYALKIIERPLINTLIIAGCTSIISAFLGFFSGYGFARYRVGGSHLLFWILSIRFLPPIVAVIPYYLLFRALGILDTYPAVIIPHLCIGIPFAVWLMRSFIMSIPIELEEAALVDGCSRLAVLFKIVFPLALPGFLITIFFTFIWSWNEFMYALILTDVHVRVMTVTIAGMREAHGLMWGAVSAAATVATLPTMALAVVLQKYLVSGLAFFTPRR